MVSPTKSMYELPSPVRPMPTSIAQLVVDTLELHKYNNTLVIFVVPV